MIEPLAPVACDLIRSRLCEGTGKNRDAARRKNGLAWVSSIDLSKPTSWKTQPPTIDTDHWNDLRLGAIFFQARDAAIDVLNEVETAVGRTDARTIVSTAAAEIPAVQKQLRELHDVAQRFLDEHSDPTDGKIATTFCEDCTTADPSQIIRTLVKRDSRVLQLRSSDILPGSAFVGRPQTDEIDEDAVGPGAENVSRIPVPEGISPRMQNLYLLELDLNHRLGTFLNPRPNEEAA